MEEEKASIRIPEDGTLTGGQKFQQETKEKLKNVDNLMYAIVAAVVISSLSALITVSAIVLDQLHFNNQTYRDSSETQKEDYDLYQKVSTMQNDINTLKLKK